MSIHVDTTDIDHYPIKLMQTDRDKSIQLYIVDKAREVLYTPKPKLYIHQTTKYKILISKLQNDPLHRYIHSYINLL